MEIPVSSITKPLLSKLIALQSFFFARPRIDIDLVNNQENLYGQRSNGPSYNQDYPEPIQINLLKYDYEFHWNFKLRIKNNSSKTAYNIKIEEIYLQHGDYLQTMDSILSLKEGEIIELDYILRKKKNCTGDEAKKFLNSFPGHLDKITIILSYTNESRTKFYSRFVATKTTKTIEHLIKTPKN